ncbi:MAG: type IV pilus secretin PilQ [Nevskiaceae bacterium]|nr:MAG: type IV pilus secretin PilQ [Nevskiaceae bacterium]TBR72637.1 MAG: type IV pilus secretin PilQ [Nevskiaceae bacterium]
MTSAPILVRRSTARWHAGPILLALCVALAGARVSVAGATETVPGAANPAGNNLQSVEVSPRNGDQATVRLHLSAPLGEAPGSFMVHEPARLVVDLPDTAPQLARRYQRLDAGVLRAWAAVAAGGRTRVVFDLSHRVPYTLTVEGDDVLVNLGQAASAPPQSVAAATTTTAGQPAVRHAVNHIDFRRGEGGSGRVIVSLEDSTTQVDVKQEGGRIVARFHDTSVPEALLKRLDVLDFATPVKYIDTRREGLDTVIVVTPVRDGNFEQVSYQTDDDFSLVLEPLTREQQAARDREHPRYTGQKISLDFQKIDIRALLQIVADVAQANMVVSDAVKGDIAIRLDDVPWDQALAIILQSKGLGQRRQGNVIFVAPLAEMDARRKAELESQKQVTELAPLRSELMQINYAKAEDIAKLLKDQNNSILSERGHVTVDSRTNTLLVLDTADKLADIHSLIRQLDVPVRQVQIESRIVIANNNFDRQVGTQFGLTGLSKMGQHGLITTSGTTQGTNEMIGNYLNGGGTLPINPPGLSTGGTSGGSSGGTSGGSNTGSVNYANINNPRFNLNLPVTATNPASIGLAILGSKFLVDLELQALQAEGVGEVVSNPRIITANGKEASIEQGQEIPYQESASSGATSVQFKKAVLGLTVTPQITPDGRIIMDLAITSDAVGQNVPTGNGGFAPAIDTRRVTTQVLVNDGQTVVLGGIYQDTKSHSVSKVPLLGDIPILGALFRFTENQNNRAELLVFITPRIINQALTLGTPN